MNPPLAPGITEAAPVETNENEAHVALGEGINFVLELKGGVVVGLKEFHRQPRDEVVKDIKWALAPGQKELVVTIYLQNGGVKILSINVHTRRIARLTEKAGGPSLETGRNKIRIMLVLATAVLAGLGAAGAYARGDCGPRQDPEGITQPEEER